MSGEDGKRKAPDHDLVLIHGLQNMHRWGRAFLQTLADIWGSGKVYVLYTNPSNRIWTRRYNGKTVTFIGKNSYTAGRASVETQADLVAEKVRILQETCGLGKHFHVIAHSMGGLITRKFIYDHPGTVVNVVTLGTPHHGSPLANTHRWLGVLFGARKAYANLTPEWAEEFNRKYPVAGAPLCPGGKFYTLRGFADGSLKHRGVFGEVWFGWHTLRALHRQTASDGLVPADSALIEGAIHAADFDDCDHLGLATRADVAKTCAACLLGDQAVIDIDGDDAENGHMYLL